LRLVDLQGKVLYMDAFSLLSGQTERTYDFERFGKGLYFVEISSRDKFDIVKIVLE
jgi:hypothetical protein